jgi:hypothetical protein
VYSVGSACYQLHAGFLLGLFLDLEDGGDIFFRNVCYFQRTTRRYIQEDRTLHDHRCEDLKSYTEREVTIMTRWKIPTFNVAILHTYYYENLSFHSAISMSKIRHRDKGNIIQRTTIRFSDCTKDVSKEVYGQFYSCSTTCVSYNKLKHNYTVEA